MGRLVERACRRRESVGADGLIFVNSSDQYDFAWQYFNADGGEVEMCGNGSRCVARFAFSKGIAGDRMTFETLAGPISAEVRGRTVKVLMPRPSNVQMDLQMELKSSWVSVDSINTGVPHVVVRVENLGDHPVVEEGRMIRYHDLFSPQGTNANFMVLHEPDLLEVRTYERGVEDETLACGTGAMASALVSSSRGMVTSPVRVKTRGGEELKIHFEESDGVFEQVWLEGSTTLVYQANLHEEALY
jgi:diaminopimelate epimerase